MSRSESFWLKVQHGELESIAAFLDMPVQHAPGSLWEPGACWIGMSEKAAIDSSSPSCTLSQNDSLLDITAAGVAVLLLVWTGIDHILSQSHIGTLSDVCNAK